MTRTARLCGLCAGAAAAAVMLALSILAPAALADSIAVQPDGKILVVGHTFPKAAALARLEADGTVDRSFGSDGFVIDRRLPPLSSLALAGGGRVLGVAVGGVNLARYLPDGAPDRAFAGGGVGGGEEPDESVSPYFPEGPATLLLSPDGSIAVVENLVLRGGDTEAWVKRYDGNGAFVETVGHIRQPAGPASTARISDLLEGPGGALLGAGWLYEGVGHQSALVARFLPGSSSDYDPGFGGGAGLVRLELPGEDSFPTFKGLAWDGGKIVAAGGTGKDFLVARFDADGNPDPGFGEGGRAIPPITGPSAGVGYASNDAADVVPLGDGDVLVAGGTSEWSEWLFGKLGLVTCSECPQPLLALLDSNGDLDPSFGSGGILRLLKPDGNVLPGAVEQVVALADGKILVKGSVPVPGTVEVEAPFLARLNRDGSYDSSFGEGGLTVVRFPCTDQPRAERQRAGCIPRLRATVRLRGLQRHRPVLSLRAWPSLDWAAVGDLTLTLPKYLRLGSGFRAKLRVRGAGGDVEVHVTTPRQGKPYTVLAFSHLDPARRLRVGFQPGALHLRGRLPRKGLAFKLRAHFLDSRWETWGGHDEIVRWAR